MSWIIVTLKPNQSQKAEENLVKQGFKTFFPKITYSFQGKSITKDLFPGYAFIYFTLWEKLVSINSTKGISRVMSINHMIPQLSDSVIEKIKKQLNDLNSRFLYQEPFKKNDMVTIKLKLFKHQEAEVLEVSNKQNTQKVLIKILNSTQTFWLDSKDLDLYSGI